MKAFKGPGLRQFRKHGTLTVRLVSASVLRSSAQGCRAVGSKTLYIKPSSIMRSFGLEAQGSFGLQHSGRSDFGLQASHLECHGPRSVKPESGTLLSFLNLASLETLCRILLQEGLGFRVKKVRVG